MVQVYQCFHKSHYMTESITKDSEANQWAALSVGTTQPHTDSPKISPTQIAQHVRFCPHDGHNPAVCQSVQITTLVEWKTTRKKKFHWYLAKLRVIEHQNHYNGLKVVVSKDYQDFGRVYIWKPSQYNSNSQKEEKDIQPIMVHSNMRQWWWQNY